MEIIGKDAASYLCPFDNFEPCRGAKCMAFQWAGQTHERCETDNLIETPDGQRPEGSPSTPSGDGWLMDGSPFQKGYHRSEKDKLPKATGQRWVRPVEQVNGFCGRVGQADRYW